MTFRVVGTGSLFGPYYCELYASKESTVPVVVGSIAFPWPLRFLDWALKRKKRKMERTAIKLLRSMNYSTEDFL